MGAKSSSEVPKKKYTTQYKTIPFPFISTPTHPITRSDISTSSHLNLFQLDQFMTNEECEHLIKISEENGYSTVDDEYDQTYRKCSRLVLMSNDLANVMWERIKLHFVKRDIENVRPYGFGNKGVWIPMSINDCIRFTRYSPGDLFRPHKDGPYVEDDDYRSIYTIMIYLNTVNEDGETLFYEDNEEIMMKHNDPSSDKDLKVLYSIKPIQGKALIFNHDVLHSGKTIQNGFKYIIRTDIMFHRISLEQNIPTLYYLSDPNYHKAMEYYNISKTLRDQGDQVGSTEAYLQGLKLQAKLKSIPLNIESGSTWLPDELWYNIFKRLPLVDIVNILLVSKYFFSLSTDNKLWKLFYKLKWKKIDIEEDNDLVLKNWFVLYRDKVIKQKFNSSIIVDIGFYSVKYCYMGNNTIEIPNPLPSLFCSAVGHLWGAGNGLSKILYASDIKKLNELDDETFKRQISYVEPRCLLNNLVDTYYYNDQGIDLYIYWIYQEGFKEYKYIQHHPLILIDHPRFNILKSIEESKNKRRCYTKFIQNITVLNPFILALRAHNLDTGIVLSCGASHVIVAVIHKGIELMGLRVDLTDTLYEKKKASTYKQYRTLIPKNYLELFLKHMDANGHIPWVLKNFELDTRIEKTFGKVAKDYLSPDANLDPIFKYNSKKLAETIKDIYSKVSSDINTLLITGGKTIGNETYFTDILKKWKKPIKVILPDNKKRISDVLDGAISYIEEIKKDRISMNYEHFPEPENDIYYNFNDQDY